MEAELPLCGLSPFPPADKERRSAVPSPVDISTPNMKKKKKKKGLEDDHSLLLTDGQALKQKKKREEEEDKHMHEMKEREESDEINMIAAEGSTRKHKKKIRDEENRVAPAMGLTDQETKKKKMEDKVEDDNVLLPASAYTQKEKKKNLEEAHSVFPADKSSRKKRNRQEEKDDIDDSVSTADELACKTKKSKKIEEAEDDDGVLPADVQKEKKKKKEKRQEENMLSDDSAASKHKKKKKKKKRDNEDEESIFPADAHTQTKKRTVEEEGGILLPGMQEMEEEEVATATATTEEINGPEERDGSVSMETDATVISDDDDNALSPVLVAQLEEFVPNVRTRPLREIKKLLNHDLHRFQIFKQQGLQIRWGRFTREENQRIRDNMAHILAVTGIASTDQLLFPHRYKDLEAEIRKLKKQHGFIEAIAEGIPRTCRQVLTRAWKLDTTNHMGEFSDEEVHHLIKLQKLHGNDWSIIAKKMGRSKYALQKRFAQTSSGRGTWTSEEEGRLKEAVKAHLEVIVPQSSADSEDGKLKLRQLCQDLPWMEISQYVRTRNWTQCRLKWFSVLRHRLAEKTHRKSPKGLRIKIQLISTLYALNIEDARDIDWEAVAEIVGGVTPVCVQKLFRSLKVSYVPGWSQLSYGEIIDFLQDRVAPRLQNQLYRYSQYVEDDEAEQQLPPNDAYTLFDIFTSGEDGDFVEVDNTQRSKRRSVRWLECAPISFEEVSQITADDAQPNGQSEPLTSDI